MNAPFGTARSVALPSPLEFEALLPGEAAPGYLRRAPRSAIEWLLAIDLVKLSWEIQRYRLLRQKFGELPSQGNRAIDSSPSNLAWYVVASRAIRTT
jgi:hypothetical protein